MRCRKGLQVNNGCSIHHEVAAMSPAIAQPRQHRLTTPSILSSDMNLKQPTLDQYFWNISHLIQSISSATLGNFRAAQTFFDEHFVATPRWAGCQTWAQRHPPRWCCSRTQRERNLSGKPRFFLDGWDGWWWIVMDGNPFEGLSWDGSFGGLTFVGWFYEYIWCYQFDGK